MPCNCIRSSTPSKGCSQRDVRDYRVDSGDHTCLARVPQHRLNRIGALSRRHHCQAQAHTQRQQHVCLVRFHQRRQQKNVSHSEQLVQLNRRFQQHDTRCVKVSSNQNVLRWSSVWRRDTAHGKAGSCRTRRNRTSWFLTLASQHSNTTTITFRFLCRMTMRCNWSSNGSCESGCWSRYRANTIESLSMPRIFSFAPDLH
jgi:hypothetical protein